MKQYRLTLIGDKPMRFRPEWAYGLYANLLSLAPPSFGTETHLNGKTPICQHLILHNNAYVWTVTLWGDACCQTLSPILEGQSQYYLKKDNLTLTVADIQLEKDLDAEAFLSRASSHKSIHRLHFYTPTAFKSQGKYVNLPTPRLLVQSLAGSWNAHFPECPIEDVDGQGLDALAAGLVCSKFRLFDRSYGIKGVTVSGFVGDLTLDNRLVGFHKELCSALLLFADYAGVGIKTTLGMGGVKHLES